MNVRKLRHECCTNARALLVVRKKHGVQAFYWMLRIPAADGGSAQTIRALYCPWCGVDLSAVVAVDPTTAL